MGLRWVFTCLLLWSLGCWTVWGKKVPCMTTRAECRSTGYSSMSIINNNYYCCAPGYGMSMRNSQCSCTKTSQVVNCTRGLEACGHAYSRSTDGQGNTVCCPNGFSMQNQAYTLNGQRFSRCACTRRLRGGEGNIISFTGNGMVTVGDSNSINNTAVTERIEKWTRKFRSNMRRTMQELSRRMERMKNRLQSFFSNMFRG